MPWRPWPAAAPVLLHRVRGVSGSFVESSPAGHHRRVATQGNCDGESPMATMLHASRALRPAARAASKTLLSAEPVVDFTGERRRERIILEGEVPSPTNPPGGCRFRNRCWKAQPACGEAPELAATSDGHLVACHFPE